MVNIKGYEFREITIRDSYNRRALQYKNQLITFLKKCGLTEDDMDIPLEGVTLKKAQASVSWYMRNDHLYYSYNRSAKFVENLAMVAQVIKHFFTLLTEGEIPLEDFIKLFEEDKDVVKQRKEAREVLGIKEDSTDFEEMHKNFKDLSKKHHPDMPEGDTETFKKINKAHKILKKELD